MQNKTDLPRICYVLGGEENPLRIGEKFRIRREGDMEFRIENDGSMVCADDGFCFAAAICAAINHPEKIIKLPFVSDSDFSADELGFMRVWIKAGFTWVARDKNKNLYVYHEKPELRERGIFKGVGYEEMYRTLFPQITHENSPIDMRLICGEVQDD